VIRIGTAAAVAALTLSATCASALALENPIVAQLHPVGNSGVRGNVTFMQLSGDVNVGVDLEKDVTNAAADIASGTCSAPASERYPLVPVNGESQMTRFSNASLQQFVGKIVVIHKTSSSRSPIVACGEIKG
jgi:hypothetical protein